MKASKWLYIAVLLVTAVFFTQLYPYHLIVRFAVALGAFVVMMQGLSTRHYAFAALFAATVLLYNPFVPTFLFAGGWQRLFVLASVFPFLASLAWMNAISRVGFPKEESHGVCVTRMAFVCVCSSCIPIEMSECLTRTEGRAGKMMG